jgi:unsaturated pyranuronate lyase
MALYNWQTIEEEQLNPRLSRRVIHTPRITIARLLIQKDAVVPEHSHEHEQVTMVERGALKFILDGREHTVGAGQALTIPPLSRHSVEALEDSVVIDVFSPCREDWIRGDDAYLRR